MKLEDTKKFKINFEDPLLRKLYAWIKKRNYYLDENDIVIELELIGHIEDFFIRNKNITYVYTEKLDIALLNQKEMYESRGNMKYYKLAVNTYKYLEPLIKEYIKINTNRDKYKDTKYTDEERMMFLLNSASIVRTEAESIKDIFPELYSDMIVDVERFENQVHSIDANQNKQSQFLSYKKTLIDGNINFVYKGYKDLIFYPIVVDIFLDYYHIMDVLNTHSAGLKKTNKRYGEYRSKISDDYYDEIHPLYNYLVKFSKQERKNNIKRYILYFYLELFDHNENINILFRKLFLNDLDNNGKSFKPEEMQKYMPKTHQIFNFAANIRLFL